MRNSKKVIGIGALLLIAVAFMAFSCVSRRNSETESQAELKSKHSVTLTWQPTPGAKFYYIYRSTTSKSGYQKIGTSPTPTYKDAPVLSRATFYYVVTAVGDKGESQYSSEIKAVVP